MNSRWIMDLAILPGIVLAVLIYKQDKIEKEPIGLLIKLGLAGAATVVSAIILELAGCALLGLCFSEDSLIYILLENIVVVAGSEEAGKYFVSKKLTWKNPAFNYRFDGIVYCMSASIGFAIVENISYAFSYGFANTIVRALTAVPAHTIFGIMMGHFYGQAKYYYDLGDEKTSKRYRRLAYLVPVLLHGAYDVLAGDDSLIGWLLFIVFVIVMDVIAFKRVKKDSREDTPV